VKPLVTAFVAGAVFGVGLVVSGMTLPTKVIGFLDVAGDWDPALAFVMVGAIAVHLATRPLVLRKERPVFADRFPGPFPATIDARLVGGAAVFGLGWGLAGFCPGPAIVSALVAGAPAAVFVAAMLVGMVGMQQLQGVSTPDPSPGAEGH